MTIVSGWNEEEEEEQEVAAAKVKLPVATTKAVNH